MDISACKGEDCKLKDSCKRYLAHLKASQYQAYIKSSYNCEFYWKVNEKGI